MSSRKVANDVGLLPSEVNRIRKKHFENIDMPRRGRMSSNYLGEAVCNTFGHNMWIGYNYRDNKRTQECNRS